MKKLEIDWDVIGACFVAVVILGGLVWAVFDSNDNKSRQDSNSEAAYYRGYIDGKNGSDPKFTSEEAK